VQQALSDKRGLVIVTAHTAGWQIVGPLFARRRGLRIMIAVAPERDAAASAIQDATQFDRGALVVHVGDDVLSGLPLIRHLRSCGAVALQIDRTPPGTRSRNVRMFGALSRVPEGPLMLGALTGAPILPVFSARTGYRRYDIVAYPPIRLAQKALDGELQRAAQAMADSCEDFARSFPTQWFHFREQ
jgi:KDO2-lipid IV(A) lauroyltransferase